MTHGRCITVRNGESCDLAQVPILTFGKFREQVLQAVEQGSWIATFSAYRNASHDLQAIAVLADAESGTLAVFAAPLPDSYESMTPDCPQAHWFERELAEQWGVRPLGHPWLKPIRFQRSNRGDRDGGDRLSDAEIVPGVTDYFRVEGEEVHEVAVGPVHAGIIEPGHFRFQCHGEQVFHLEISLGYQHRGVERSLVGGPNSRTLHLMETLAGDTTIGHALAYCQIVESLAQVRVPVRAAILRAVALELERIANHTGDLGALSGDVGFLPTASFCGRLRGDVLNMSALLCGNRFGRGMLCPGGVRFDADTERLRNLSERLEKTLDDLTGAIELLWQTPSVMSRFEETGFVSRENAIALAFVGPTARACGIERDIRSEFPTGIYGFANIPVATWHTGDVFARAFVRWIEIQRAAAFVKDQIKSLPQSEIRTPFIGLDANKIAVSMVEGWRGAICHVAVTDSDSRFVHYKVVDPSFHNWFGLALAMRNQQISDFPLCNKSFNLSYCGHDL